MWANDDEQDRHPLYGYLSYLRGLNKMPKIEAQPELTLEQEVEALRQWKEEAIEQLQKSNRLYRLIGRIGGYVGWDVYDAAIDLIKRNCPCCGYPNCGHKHPVK